MDNKIYNHIYNQLLHRSSGRSIAVVQNATNYRTCLGSKGEILFHWRVKVSIYSYTADLKGNGDQHISLVLDLQVDILSYFQVHQGGWPLSTSCHMGLQTDVRSGCLTFQTSRQILNKSLPCNALGNDEITLNENRCINNQKDASSFSIAMHMHIRRKCIWLSKDGTFLSRAEKCVLL